jgi:hypothetical protein
MAQINPNLEKNKRPIAITVICVLGAIGAILSIPAIFSGIGGYVGEWYPPYLLVNAIIGIVCMVGFWKMKKWAAYMYAGFSILNQIILLSAGLWSIQSLILPAIVVAIALSHLKNMD